MINDNQELLLDLWSRIKDHIQPKERLEVADILMGIFDEYGLVDDSVLDEDLDKELRAAARSLFADIIADKDEDDEFSD